MPLKHNYINIYKKLINFFIGEFRCQKSPENRQLGNTCDTVYVDIS